MFAGGFCGSPTFLIRSYPSAVSKPPLHTRRLPCSCSGVGVNLRTVILGVPPTLPALHRSLPLLQAAGLLTSVPVLLMAAGDPEPTWSAAWCAPGGRGGAALVALGPAARRVPQRPLLFACTSSSRWDAVAQPAMPSPGSGLVGGVPRGSGAGGGIASTPTVCWSVRSSLRASPCLCSWCPLLAGCPGRMGCPGRHVLALWLIVTPATEAAVDDGRCLGFPTGGAGACCASGC